MSGAGVTPLARVGVFDSGVGGLSVLKAIRQRLPELPLAYCMDNANLPYGTKAPAELVAMVRSVTAAFVQRAAIDILVVACNTASTYALAAVRQDQKIPVVGVVPAIKPAAALTRTGTIGLLATPATVQGSYGDDLVRDFAQGRRVLRFGSSRLVAVAEDKLRGRPVPPLADEVAPLFAQSPKDSAARLDTVVLGCTHFPLLGEELRAAAPWPVTWLDSGEAIAARVEQLLSGLSGAGLPEVPGAGATAYVTSHDASALELLPALVRYGLLHMERLEALP